MKNITSIAQHHGIFSAVALALAVSACGAEVGDSATVAGADEIGSTEQALVTSANVTWVTDGANAGSVVSRAGSTTLDRLLINMGSGMPGRWHRNSSGAWSFEAITGSAPGVTVGALDGTYSGGGGYLDVFLRGNDGKIYWTFKDTVAPSNWAPWSTINGSTSVKPDSTIAVTNRGFGNIEVFWVTNQNTIARVSIDNNFTPHPPEFGSPSAPWFQPPSGFAFTGEIRAASWDNNRIDVFVRAGNKIVHSWFDGAWTGVTGTHRETLTSTFSASSSTGSMAWTAQSLVATSPGPGVVDLVAIAQSPTSSGSPLPPAELATVQFTAPHSWPLAAGPGNWVKWRPVTANGSLPGKFYGAAQYNDFGIGRVHIIGGINSGGRIFDADIQN